MNPPTPEHGSETFTRWAKAVWPYTIGVFGMVLIFADVAFLPPPGANPTTSGIGCFLITGQGVLGLELHRRRLGDDH